MRLFRDLNIRALTIAVFVTLALAITVAQHQHQPAANTEDEHMHMDHGNEQTGARKNGDSSPISTSSAGGTDHHDCDMMSMSMPMYFTMRSTGVVLFPFIDITRTISYVALCIGIIIGCILREHLHTYRLELERQNMELALLHSAAAASSLHSSDGSIRLETHRKCCGLVSTPVLSTILYGFNMALAYLIMLLIMTYDGIFFILIILSSGLAHYYFQYHRPGVKAAEASRMRVSSPHSPGHHLRHPRHGDSGDEEEHEALTPSLVHETSINRTSSGTPMSASKKAAISLAITKDCCES